MSLDYNALSGSSDTEFIKKLSIKSSFFADVTKRNTGVSAL